MDLVDELDACVDLIDQLRDEADEADDGIPGAGNIYIRAIAEIRRLRTALEAREKEAADTVALSKDEARLAAQWFGTVQDVAHENYLQVHDYTLAAKLYHASGLRLPNSINIHLKPEPIATKVVLPTCPDCDGKGSSFVFVNTGLDSSKHYSEVQRCDTCKGAGFVSQDVIKAKEEGMRLRKARQAAGLTLRDAARLEGVSVSVISGRELGRPTPLGADDGIPEAGNSYIRTSAAIRQLRSALMAREKEAPGTVAPLITAKQIRSN